MWLGTVLVGYDRLKPAKPAKRDHGDEDRATGKVTELVELGSAAPNRSSLSPHMI